jgi:hypothetical protein
VPGVKVFLPVCMQGFRHGRSPGAGWFVPMPNRHASQTRAAALRRPWGWKQLASGH